MKILAIETIGISASVALLEDETVLSACHLEPQKRSSRYLTLTVRDLLAEQNWKPTDVQLVAVAHGPGSFTGLRVGISFAKVFAYAIGADILALNTLDVLAAGIPTNIQRVSIALDAQRGQVAARVYERQIDGSMKSCGEMEVLDFEDWSESASADTFLSGPILHQKSDRLPQNALSAPQECWDLSVEMIGKMASKLRKDGRKDDLWNLLPIYSRPAAAEERKLKNG